MFIFTKLLNNKHRAGTSSQEEQQQQQLCAEVTAVTAEDGAKLQI